MGVGVAVGLVVGHAVSYALRHSDVDRGASFVFTLVLAVAVPGIARLLQADGVLAVFIAGLAYDHTVADDEVNPQKTVDEGVNRYLVVPLFLLLGVELPWSEWADVGWGAIQATADWAPASRPRAGAPSVHDTSLLSRIVARTEPSATVTTRSKAFSFASVRSPASRSTTTTVA